MAKPKRLLAKSSHSPDGPKAAETLRGHTAFVCAAARQLIAHRARHAIRAAGLVPSLERTLERLVLAGAFLHDIGKCSDHFQQTVRRQRSAPQLLRHEACSLYLAWPGQPLAEWFRQGLDQRELCFALVVAAAHHRKFWSRAIAPEDAGTGTQLMLWTSHADFARTLELGAKQLGLGAPPVLSDVLIKDERRSPLRKFFERCEDEIRRLEVTDAERRLLAIAKALVLDADVAGSALPRAGENPNWVGDVLTRARDAAELELLISDRLGGRALRPFQAAVANSRAPVTLVRAGCGSGKTIAAYAWAARCHAGATLWVTYPTTGTTTEGYRDYVHEADLRGRLEHGRARVDVDIFGLDEPDEVEREADRLDALRAWDMDVVVCTVDTVLGLVQNQRKGLYAFASLVESAVVFDEIHAYDDALFGALLRFLNDLPGVPALLMTASLPKSRLEALRQLVRAVHGCDMAEIEGPADLERLPRYEWHNGPAWPEVARVLATDGKVLWVSNTVDRCIETSSRSEAGAALVYHSRFRYEDRVARHAAVIRAFADTSAVFASTTQVAEMSLDLSADLLVTDLAPIPAMIQRLGRLNRRTRPDSPVPPAPFIVIDVNSPLPYRERELDEAREWLARLGHSPLSQRDLVDAWLIDDRGARPIASAAANASAWLDGVFRCEPSSLRESTPGITVMLAQDCARVASEPGRAPRFAIPMPPPKPAHAWRSWRRAAGIYPVPPPDAIDYDPLKGARWRRAS
ncbi:MAG: CRISPR-associated helicase Cas3' [Phycisphaerales bacterium]|nr:CRISPR-associated helicase Cas3' [Phycisphaerales bacterium]